jgi:hypothetical protein
MNNMSNLFDEVEAELLKQFKAITPVAPEGERSDDSERYGHARDNIRVNKKKRAVAVVVNWGAAFWMFFYEYGRKGQPKTPIYRPHWDSNYNRYAAEFVRRLRMGFTREVRAIARRRKKAGAK